MASDLQRMRRRVGVSLVAVVGLAGFWLGGPGLPILWAPRASAEMQAAGKMLFEHEWTPQDPLAGGDGLGPVFNAKSCAACHFLGGLGGAGPNQHNVTTFEALPGNRRPQFASGLIHRFAVAPSWRESGELVRKLFPTETFTADCRTQTFDPVRMESINTTALFGVGWIDRISDRNISYNSMQKGLEKMMTELHLDFDTVPPGRARVLADGRVGKFGWRAQFATLREFVAAACANELGLGNSLMEQAKPLGQPNVPAAKPDLNDQQLAELTAYVDTLPRPVEVIPPGPQRTVAEHGKKVFAGIGCVICHVPSLGGVDGIYSDLLLHDLGDVESDSYGKRSPVRTPVPEGHPLPSEWKTPPLWGVADSAPYFHDGGAATLEAAVLRHRGDAQRVTKAYKALPREDQTAVIAFLSTLKAPVPAPK